MFGCGEKDLTAIYIQVKLLNVRIWLQVTQQHYRWIEAMQLEYIIYLLRQSMKNDANKHAQIKRRDRLTKNKDLLLCQTPFF